MSEPRPSRESATFARSWVPRVVLPAALLGAYAIVQAVYLRPLSPEGKLIYFERAAAFPDLHPDHWSLRIGLLLPVRLFQEVFGYSEAAYYAVPFLAAAALLLATYWLGWKLFDPAVGLGAALLLLFSFPFLKFAGVLGPDMPGAALATVALCLLVGIALRHERARSDESDGNSPPRPWVARDHALLVGVGVLLGWAYLVREFIVFLFPAVAFVFFCYGLAWRKLAWVAGGALGLFVGEAALNAAMYGSPFERLLVAGGHGGQRDSITDSRLDALLRLPRLLAERPGTVSALVLLALLLVFAAALRRRSFRLLAVWFLAFWVPITLGTGLIVPSFRFLIGDFVRYWIPILPVVFVGGVAVAHHGLVFVCSRLRWPKASRALVPTLVVISSAATVGILASSHDRGRSIFRVNGADQLVQLRSWLTREGSDVDVIFTDSYTTHLIPVYAHSTFGREVWDGRVRAFDHDARFLDPSQMSRGAIVLYRPGYRILYSARPLGTSVVPRRDSPIPRYVRDPPPTWELVIRRADASLVVYRIER